MGFKVSKGYKPSVKSEAVNAPKAQGFWGKAKGLAQNVNAHFEKQEALKMERLKRKTALINQQVRLERAKGRLEKTKKKGGLGFDDSFWPKGL